MTEDEKFELFKQKELRDEMNRVRESLNSITNLEDDIDAPLKKTIAILALLGCRPIFSCCGFDYDGQPYHKSHQYGNAYIVVERNENSVSLFNNRNVYGWQILKGDEKYLWIELMVFSNPHWRNQTSIHFSEEIVLSIRKLENWLLDILNRSQGVPDSITLRDTNNNYPKWWQYKPKNDWVIYKDLVETY